MNCTEGDGGGGGVEGGSQFLYSNYNVILIILYTHSHPTHPAWMIMRGEPTKLLPCNVKNAWKGSTRVSDEYGL